MVRRNRTTTLLLLGVLLVMSACSTDAGQVGAPIDDAPPQVAEPSPDPDPVDEPAVRGPDDVPPVATPNGAEQVTAYFVRSDATTIWVEPETHELTTSTVGVARAAMELLVSGETHDPDLTTAAPPGTEVLGVSIRDGVLIVDLSGEVARHGSGSATEVAFAHQLAHTAAQFDGVDAVRLWVDGRAVTELWGHLDWSEPLEADPFVLSPVTFTSHTYGEEVAPGTVTVAGEARVFEAHVGLRLIDPDGTVVDESWTTASDGPPDRGDWTATFDLDRPGTWTVEAAESDPSDGEGRPPFVAVLELVARG